MTTQNDGIEYGWEEEISKDEEFVLLPPGIYEFEALSVERARHPGSAKLPPCNKAIVTFKIFASDGQTTVVTNNFFLHSKCEGMLCAFFRAIGARKQGERLKMNWASVPGSTGQCKLGIRKYNDDDYNEIKRFVTTDKIADAFDGGQSTTKQPKPYTPGSF